MVDISFTKSFSSYWNKLIKNKSNFSVADVNKDKEYAQEVADIIIFNFSNLEKCVKRNTEFIDTKLDYDITFIP